jgi:hypothetical protein
MANKSTTYRIEIQLDNARNQIADATKKLEELDAKLEGLTPGSDAAKAITAEMAKLAGEIESAGKAAGEFSEQLDSLKPGSIGALEREVEELEAAWKATTIGTEEAEAALLKLGNAKGRLRELEDAVDALHPKEKAAAFVDLANGVAGVVGVATAAGQAFGLSQESADKYAAKLQTVIALTSSFEAISKALNSESRANIKNLLAQAKAYITGGEAATQGGKAARIAIASTGIGLLVVALGLVVANWDKLTGTIIGSKGQVTKFGEVSSGVWAAFKKDMSLAGDAVKKLFKGDFEGVAQVWRSRGYELAKAFGEGEKQYRFEKYKERLAMELSYNEQVLAVAKAKGYDTFKFEEKLLEDKIILLDKGAEDYKEKLNEAEGALAVLRATHRKKEEDDELAATLARLNKRIALEQAAGNDSYQTQLRAEELKLEALKKAGIRNEAAIIDQQKAIELLTVAHEQELAAKRRAAVTQTFQDQIDQLEAQGKDTLSLRIQLARELLALDTGTSQKERDQRKRDLAALNLLLTEQSETERTIRQDQADQRADYDALDVDARARFRAAVGAEGERLLEKQAAIKTKTTDLGRDLLVNFFGVSPDKVAEVKAVITQAVGELYDSFSQLGAAMNEGAIMEADARLQEAQQRLQELDQQLQDRQSSVEKTAADLAGADGARREYLVQRLAKERAEVARLAAEKAKAARAEETATKKKHELEKQGQVIAAASALATNIATAAAAVYAGVRAVSAGSEVPFPGNIFAIAAGLAAVVAAVASAKSLSNATKYADGGTLDDQGVLRGPSHAQNGIQLFGRNGAYYGEAEGGEGITPRDATANNLGLLYMLRTVGRRRALTAADLSGGLPTVKAPSSWHYANGGNLPTAGLPASSDLTAMRAAVEQQTALLTVVVAHTGNTAAATRATADYGPARFNIGPGEALAIGEEAKKTLPPPGMSL